jgi:hypothetical protein
MKTLEIHPLSVTVGAVAALVLLFACSSRSGASPSTPPVPVPAVTTQVTFYSDIGSFSASNPWAGSVYSYNLGSTVASTVITDIAWTDSSVRSRLLVNGVPVYAWGFGGASGSPTGFASPSWLSLAHGIRVPAGASMVIETMAGGTPPAWSLAGYTL